MAGYILEDGGMVEGYGILGFWDIRRLRGIQMVTCPVGSLPGRGSGNYVTTWSDRRVG
jgi:hypothetical protein